jgi:hypothetical protein
VSVQLAIAATIGSAPWWGIPCFTLGGVLGGAAVTQAFTMLTSKRASKLARDIQFRDEASGAATDLLNEVNKSLNRAVITKKVRDDNGLYLCWAQLPLTCSDSVVIAGNQLVRAYVSWSMDWARAQRAADDSDDKGLRDSYHGQRLKFINVMRTERGIKGLDRYSIFGNESQIG